MKLYELLTKIDKGEIKEGTRVINQSLEDEYIIKNGNLHLCCNDNLFAAFNTERLNDEVEIIEPAPGKDVGTNEEIKEIGTRTVSTDFNEIISEIFMVEHKLNETIRTVNKINRDEQVKRFG